MDVQTWACQRQRPDFCDAFEPYEMDSTAPALAGNGSPNALDISLRHSGQPHGAPLRRAKGSRMLQYHTLLPPPPAPPAPQTPRMLTLLRRGNHHPGKRRITTSRCGWRWTVQNSHETTCCAYRHTEKGRIPTFRCGWRRAVTHGTTCCALVNSFFVL